MLRQRLTGRFRDAATAENGDSIMESETLKTHTVPDKEVKSLGTSVNLVVSFQL